MNELQQTLNKIKGGVTNAQSDLETAKSTPADPASGDRFVEAIEVIRIK